LPIVQESDHRWSGACAFVVGNYDRFVADHDGDARVGGAEVNAYDLSHIIIVIR
ncbi:MAG: hypothetical protein RIQ78_1282, partial [Bacteroidota bacterium]